MVVRAGYGIFYDHPLLAVAFNSFTAEGGRSVQLLSAGGTPSACGLITPECSNGLDSTSNLNGSSIFQGVLNRALPSMGYLSNEQRFDPLLRRIPCLPIRIIWRLVFRCRFCPSPCR